MNDEVQAKPRRVGILLALAAGIALRLCGLSHDLHAGHEYHPDVPKQVRAAERYLKGKYYHHTGLSDYDGYPLFHAHLTEYLVRGYTAAAQGVCDLVGLEARLDGPSLTAIQWLMRVLNVILSTLAILLVFRIVLPLAGPAPALFGAWLMALSPSDMAGAHYGAGDPAAAFFALWAVERALALWRSGRTRDYLLAAAAAVCAFGAKYHAGMCLLPIGLAHLLRQPSVRTFFGAASIRRIVLLVVTCTVALFLVIPSMFERPGTVLQEIVDFLSHVSSGDRLASQLQEDSFQARFAFSMRRNGPVLVDILSWPAIAAVLAGLWLGLRRDRALLILVSLPLAYFLLGVSLRPLAHPVYHVLMTGPVFALAAVLGARLWRGGLPGARLAATALGAWSLLALGQQSAREGFLFQQRDLRRVAKDWAMENVPSSLVPEVGAYAFGTSFFGAPGSPTGVMVVSSSIRPLRLRDTDNPLATFALEERPLPFFRNPTIRISLRDVADLAPGFRLPVFAPIPSQSGGEMVFDAEPAFLRDARIVPVSPGQPVDRVFVRAAPASNVLAVVRSSSAPVYARITFGGISQQASLGPGEARALYFPRPQPGWPRLETGLYYRSSAQVGPGDAVITWAFTDAEQGTALYQAGLHAEALAALQRASDADPAHPTLALLARLAASASSTASVPRALDERAAPFASPWTGDRVRTQFGISTAYMDALPYLAWGADDLVGRGLRADAELVEPSEQDVPGDDEPVAPVPASADARWSVMSPGFQLAPGVYRLAVRYVSPPSFTQEVSVVLRECSGAIVTSAPLPVASGRTGTVELPVSLPRGLVAGRVKVQGTSAGWRIDRISLRPDVVGTLNAYGAAWRVAVGQPQPGDVEHGFAALARLDTSLADAPQPLHARFPLGLNLAGFRLRENRVARGGNAGLRLYWEAMGFAPRSSDLAVWVHVLDASGKNRFQGDHRLAEDWYRPQASPTGATTYFPVPVPADAAPGDYRIVVGLYDEKSNRRVRVVDAGSAEHDHGVMLPVTLTVR